MPDITLFCCPLMGSRRSTRPAGCFVPLLPFPHIPGGGRLIHFHYTGNIAGTPNAIPELTAQVAILYEWKQYPWWGSPGRSRRVRSFNRQERTGQYRDPFPSFSMGTVQCIWRNGHLAGGASSLKTPAAFTLHLTGRTAMMTRGTITNLANRYRAVLSKCHLANLFGMLALAGCWAWVERAWRKPTSTRPFRESKPFPKTFPTRAMNRSSPWRKID